MFQWSFTPFAILVIPVQSQVAQLVILYGCWTRLETLCLHTLMGSNTSDYWLSGHLGGQALAKWSYGRRSMLFLGDIDSFILQFLTLLNPNGAGKSNKLLFLSL